MPAMFQSLPALRLVVTRYSGILTPLEAAESCLAYFNGADFNPDQDHLFDLAAVTEFDFDFGRMMRLVSRLEPHYGRRNGDTRSALYAPGDVAFGIARMYQSLVSERVPFELGVFRTRPEALCFLGRSPDAACGIWQEHVREAPLRAAVPSWT